MPYGRPSRFKPRQYKRYKSARTLQRAWRARKQRRQGSVVARQALSNRRQIKSIKKSIESKMIETVSTTANQYSGQAFVRQTVDINGFEGTGVTNLCLKPCRGIIQGHQTTQRNGDWIKMKSLTYKIYVSAVTGVLPEQNHVMCYIVLDRNPMDETIPNWNGIVAGTPDDGTLSGGNSQNPLMRYQNMLTCGNTQRFKVLKKLSCRVQSASAVTAAVLQPDAVMSGTLKLPYNLRYIEADAPLPARPSNQELLLFFVSDSSVAPHPQVSVHCRFRYKDA